MWYKSSYRDEEDSLSPRTREWISRGTMLVIGVAMLIAGFYVMIFLAVFGTVTLIAALLPISVVEALFKATYRPPITGNNDIVDNHRWGPWWIRIWWWS